MASDPYLFSEKVRESLRRHASAVNKHAARGMYFFDYGNAFLLEASRAGADVMTKDGLRFVYPSYVQDIMGPLCFDYGFGPFRWVCASGMKTAGTEQEAWIGVISSPCEMYSIFPFLISVSARVTGIFRQSKVFSGMYFRR